MKIKKIYIIPTHTMCLGLYIIARYIRNCGSNYAEHGRTRVLLVHHDHSASSVAVQLTDVVLDKVFYKNYSLFQLYKCT